MVQSPSLTGGTTPAQQHAKRRSFMGDCDLSEARAMGEPYALPMRKAAVTRQKGVLHRPLSASVASVKSQTQPFASPENADHRKFAQWKAMLADSGIGPLPLSKMPGGSKEAAALMNTCAYAVEGYADYQAAVLVVYAEMEGEIAELRKLLIGKNDDAAKLAGALEKTTQDLGALKRSSAKFKADAEAKLEQAKNKIFDQEKAISDHAVKQRQLEAALREAKRVELALSKQITRM